MSSETAKLQSQQDSSNASMSDLGIENTNISTAPGVQLNQRQQVLVGSILDLFAGKPTLKKLQLWDDNAVFQDPITKAEGRKQYEPQWYGLKAAFSEIERLHHSVTSAGNPIELEMKTRYKVKGIGKEETISSIIQIHTDANGKIQSVMDKWNGQLPEGAIAKASWGQLISPFWWFNYYLAWCFWLWSFVWWTYPWLAFRNLNAATVPAFVSVPKSDAEDK